MPNEIDLLLPVRPAVGLEHVVKPDREPVLAGVGLIPGIPRVDRLRLAGDQAPVDRADVVLLEDREAPLEGAAGAARHVLGTENGAMVGKERLDSPRELLRCAVAVEGQDVRFLDLDLRGARPFVPGRPAAARVHAAGEGLARVGGPGPSESLRQELAHELILVRGLLRGPVTVLEGLDGWLVPEVPGEDALVLREGADDALRVGLELRVLRRVRELGAAGALHPARVVNARNRVMLLPEVRARIPDRIKQYEHRPDVMPRRDGEEGVDALPEPCGVLLPEKIV